MAALWAFLFVMNATIGLVCLVQAGEGYAKDWSLGQTAIWCAFAALNFGACVWCGSYFLRLVS